MNAERIDRICKGMTSRRGFLRAVPGAVVAAAVSIGVGTKVFAGGGSGSQAGTGSDAAAAEPAKSIDLQPSDYVTGYYQAIVSRDYGTAYQLLGEKFHQNQGFDDFMAGFANTAYMEVAVLDSNPASNGGTEVGVEVHAWLADGAIHKLTGTFTIGEEDGFATIVDSALVEGDPAGIPHFCRADDLSASVTGEEEGGDRDGTVTVTNRGDSPCVIGGFPIVTLVDEANQEVISGVPNLFAQAKSVELKPGKQASFDLVWSDWCAEPIPSDISIVVSMPNDSNSFRIKGDFGVPSCSSSDATSRLSVEVWT